MGYKLYHDLGLSDESLLIFFQRHDVAFAFPFPYVWIVLFLYPILGILIQWDPNKTKLESGQLCVYPPPVIKYVYVYVKERARIFWDK